MNRYLIESKHTKDDCLHALTLVAAHGYITHFDWGCKVGEHTGWAIIEADSEQEALLAVPSLTRNKARAILLTKYTPDDIKLLHDKSGG